MQFHGDRTGPLGPGELWRRAHLFLKKAPDIQCRGLDLGGTGVEENASQATVLLARLAAGDPSAADELMPLVYDALREVARRQMRRESPAHTLQPTALVHEAWLRLMGQTRMDWVGRSQFLGIAATMMRRVLIEKAREGRRLKRGGGKGHRVTLDPDLVASSSAREADHLDLDQALRKLKLLHERQERVVVLRCYGGLSVEETAKLLAVSHRTVEDDWAMARAWLRRELERSVSE
jgi:RNA polymerase sigma factor (TIGR02999 family)